MNMSNLFVATVSAVTRLACLTFVVVAGMTIPQAWDLLNENTFTKEGNVVYVPLEQCSRSSITIDNAQLNLNKESTNDDCHTLQYFINASVASMFFSGAAILIFVLWDSLSKYCTRPIARSFAIMGMSLFLIFILFQTAAVNYALYKECNYWEDYYLDRFKDSETSAVITGYSNNLDLSDIEDVQTYGDPFFFFLTCIMALTCSGLLLLDALVDFVFGRTTKPTNDDTAPIESSTDSTQRNSNTTTNSEAKSAVPEEDPSPEQPVDHKNWTSY
jgi:hypothetical protein